MPQDPESTRRIEAGLWLKSAFELAARRYLTQRNASKSSVVCSVSRSLSGRSLRTASA